MHTDFSDDQIEYAGRLLNHREQLDDREVQEWLEHPENRAVLDNWPERDKNWINGIFLL